MIQTVHIVEDLIAEMVVELNVSKVEDLGNNQYKLYVCNTQYLNTGFLFQIGGKEAVVISFVFNEYLIIEVVGFLPTKGTYILPPPFYFYGTVRAVNDELSEIPYQEGKYPYVFLLERMTEAFNSDEENLTDRISPLKLYFLTNYDEGKWQTKDHYKEIIEPMSNLREIFITLLKKSNRVNDEVTFEDDWSGTNYVRFGTYTEQNGNLKSLMNEDVSGVGLEINVVFLKILNCNKNVCL